ncbi:MAG: alpha/beta fold hydrolase [Chloroflexia bacterium]
MDGLNKTSSGKEPKRGSWKRWLLLLLLIPVVAVVGFVVWASMAAQPMPEALAAIQSDAQVKVSTDKWLVFSPIGKEADTALIFYPGAKVDARAYAPAAHRLAAEGYLVVITPMFLNLAVFGSDQANDVIAAYPNIGKWAIGGHSLGGAFAAHYAYGHPTKVKGLVLLAAYPPDSDDMSQQDISVISIYGTLDGLATPDKIKATKKLLPANTKYVAIEGGDHAQFGWYGPQDGDNAATISREAQQDQVVAATEELLKGLK